MYVITDRTCARGSTKGWTGPVIDLGHAALFVRVFEYGGPQPPPKSTNQHPLCSCRPCSSASEVQAHAAHASDRLQWWGGVGGAGVSAGCMHADTGHHAESSSPSAAVHAYTPGSACTHEDRFPPESRALLTGSHQQHQGHPSWACRHHCREAGVSRPPELSKRGPVRVSVSMRKPPGQACRRG